MWGRKSDKNPEPAQAPAGGTRIVSAPVADGFGAPTGNDPEIRTRDILLQQRPLAGALFSASADGMGEIFPLYIGRNTIGNNPECDIYLSEATVGVNHAVILIRVIPDDEGTLRMTASVTDYDSDYGTLVDSQPAGFDKIPLRGGECIRIGLGYVFVLQLFDSSLAGLGRNPLFSPTERIRGVTPASHPEMEDEEIYPNAIGAEDEFSFYGRPPGKPQSPSRRPAEAEKNGFYNAATRRNPDAAPGTVLNDRK